MRRFAADVIPGLRLSPTEAPRPWVLPSGATRAERDRLTHLLIQALRRFDPALQVIQLRWIERRLLSGGRLSLPDNTLIWWRVQVDGGAPRDARALAQEAESLHGGLHLLDIDGPIVNERLGWLGPLKLAVYYGVIDALHEPRPWPNAEALAEVLNELVTLVLSPLDLLDLAESLIDKATSGMRPAEARAWALGHHIAARLNPQSAEDCVGCLHAVAARFGGKPLEGESRVLWIRAGLLDPEAEDALPIVGTLVEAEVARVAVTQLTLRQHPGRPLKELVPAELLPVERSELPHIDLNELMSSAPSAPWFAGLAIQGASTRLSEEEARPIEARLLRALREGRTPSPEDLEHAKDVVDVILSRVHQQMLRPEEASAELRRAVELAEVMVKDREQRARALLETADEAWQAGDLGRSQLAFDEANELYGGVWPQVMSDTAVSMKARILFSQGRYEEAIQVADMVTITTQSDAIQRLRWIMMRTIVLFSLLNLSRDVEAIKVVTEIVKVGVPLDDKDFTMGIAKSVLMVGHLMRTEWRDEWASLLDEAEVCVRHEPQAKLLIEAEKVLLKFEQSPRPEIDSDLNRIWLLRQQIEPLQAARVAICLTERALEAQDIHRAAELLNIILDPAEKIEFPGNRQRVLEWRDQIVARLNAKDIAPE